MYNSNHISIYTLMIYLNNDFDGGNTIFYDEIEDDKKKKFY